MRLGRFAIVVVAMFSFSQGLTFRPARGDEDVVANVVEAIEAVAGALTPAKRVSNDTPTGGLAELLAEPLALDEAAAGDKAKVAPDDPVLKRLRPILFRELGFVRAIGDLPLELRAKVKTAMIDALGEIKKGLKDQNWQDGIIWINASDDQRSDPANAIRAKLLEVLKRELPPDTYGSIEKEWVHRQNYERAATVEAAIYLIDERMRLQEKQREAIAKGIIDNWEDRFGTWRTLAQYNWEYLPNIPDKLIKPHLTEEQVAVWDATPRHTVGMGMGGDEMGPPDELWWDGIEEAAGGDLLRDLFVDREGRNSGK
jgi:hypothetical protein